MNSDEAKFKSSQVPPKSWDDSLSSSSGDYSIPDHWHDQEFDAEPLQPLMIPDEPPKPLDSSLNTDLDLSLEANFPPESPEKQSLEAIFSPSVDPSDGDIEELQGDIARLKQQKQVLEGEVKALKAQKDQLLAQQVTEAQDTLNRMIKEGLKELEQRKQALEISVDQLERRRDRIREEMKTSFAGASQELAIRIQGFKDYLVGSLQDLVATAEQLDLPKVQVREKPRYESQPSPPPPPEPPQPQYAPQGFQSQTRKIRELLDQYRTRPDYYGPPWQLRRTFEPIHAERVQNWFFSQGGRGAVRSMGSRLQNILIASAIASVLYSLNGDRVRVLVLANSPERLGEWRRGLQDCLGISRSDFGPERGVVLFESPEALIQKADRLVEDKQMPLVILDETEDRVNLSLLQFPLWLAFAPDPQQMSSYLY